MLTKPMLKKCYCVVYQNPDFMFLISERECQIFSGRLYKEIGPLLTGEFTSIELIERLEGRFSFPEVIHFLGEMESRGYLIEAGDDQVPSETASFWHQLGVDTRTGRDRLLGKTVAASAGGYAY